MISGFLEQPSSDDVHKDLEGPILDLFNFYVDVGIAARFPLHNSGDKYLFHWPKPNYLTKRVLLWQDCIDFDFTLLSISEKNAVVRVVHVPWQTNCPVPAEWQETQLAVWMTNRVMTDTENNWAQVTKPASDGTVFAAVGREIIDV